ncbi:MAG: 1,4-dihydroxy-2-naphthoate octaprenyltransferase [Candidatus Omnitrophica bacterium]|nr:1,4-dihydroxy-2-naphthoate octaprenyltransferase [Candidatus Omnitrophota bacterium]
MNKTRVSTFKKWLLITRPSSLLISATPVFIGTSMTFGDGIMHWPSAGAALIGALLIHVVANLTNDYCDFKRGADQKGDFDPMRGIIIGIVRQNEIRRAIDISLLLFMPICFYLIARAGWPIFIIVFLSIFSAIFYTAGKNPLGYRGLGDILVFLFFGPIAVAGTYYVQTLEINAAVVLAGFAPGLFAVSILAINNIRDFKTDQEVAKNTLVVRFGELFGKIEYSIAILTATLMPLIIYSIIQDHRKILFSMVTILPAVVLIVKIFTKRNKPDLNSLIGFTVQTCLLYGIIFSIGWIVR